MVTLNAWNKAIAEKHRRLARAAFIQDLIGAALLSGCCLGLTVFILGW